MSNRDLLRLAPQDTISLALKADAEVLSTDAKLYCANNIVNYDIAINTWLHCVKDYAPYAWTYLAVRIRREGLYSTVQAALKAASQVIATEKMSDPFFWNMYQEVIKNFSVRPLLTTTYQIVESPRAIFLFLCRYLKRFTPLNADRLDEKAIKSFLDCQNRQKLIARNGYSRFLLDLIRDEVDATTINSRISAFSGIKMSDIELSPGVCYSLSGKKLRTTAEKYDHLVRDYDFNRISVLHDSVWNYQFGEMAYLTTVPKTFKSARTIAPEQCLRQAVARRMFTLSVEHTPKGIQLDDQSVNQKLAYEGSIHCNWCTIDLSHASDDNTWLLVQEIYRDFPEYLRYLGDVRPKYINITGRPRLLQSFATMGNSMTFLIESEIFYLIAKAAVHFAIRHGEEITDEVVVYGDDILVADDGYEYVTAFLEKLGFVVNDDKSFHGMTHFRESCGADWFNGEPVTGPYFPRRSLKTALDWYRDKNGNCNTVAESLFALQHRLCDVSQNAAQYVELYLRELKPDLGMVPVGTQRNVLWGYDEVCTYHRYIPEYVREQARNTQKWIYKDHCWRYIPNRYTFAKCLIQDDDHRVDYHLEPVVEVERIPLNEEVLYHMYLQKGPWYATELDRILGVSTSRRLMPTGSPRTAWKRVER